MASESFKESSPLTMGVELELQLINNDGDLEPCATRLLSILEGYDIAGEFKHEVTEGMIELVTGICQNVKQLEEQLVRLRQHLLQATKICNIRICGGGTHPWQQWQEQQISNNEGIISRSNIYSYLAKSNTVFGFHVHIGCINEEMAHYLLYSLERYIPHFIALSASSPFLSGVESQYQSVRTNILAALIATNGNKYAPHTANLSELIDYLEKLKQVKLVDSFKNFYWDIRPNLSFGTIEVRVMDTPLTLERTVNIAGFIQMLASWLWYEKPVCIDKSERLFSHFNRFNSCRYGLEGVLTTTSGEQMSIAEDINLLLPKIRPHAEKLDSLSCWEQIYQQVNSLDSDSKQMQMFMTQGNHIRKLVDHQCERWLS